ncbi:MAG: ATP-binding protein [Smithella sp.]|nr:ATP-binding protein [Smithella sp.]HQI23637.1 ATP-binding protein [Smithella sp.]
MKRYLEKYIQSDLKRKIVLLTGPRQTGKTTLAKMLKTDFDYFNYDNAEHRLSLLKKSWNRSRELVIFDELHKMKNWKSWLKGIYDTEKIPPSLIVTGSAKLDAYKKVGDSLAGRFFEYRLHPLDLKEIRLILGSSDLNGKFDKLLKLGGFPEPYLEGDETYYNRWKRSHLDIILKQDLIDLENLRHITTIETLIELLKKKVGSPISYKSLAEDLQCSDKTVKRWLSVLETLYVIYKVPPYHKNISRSLLKAPKYYFYDTGQLPDDSGMKLENLVACALLKEMHFREDCFGEKWNLCYLRNKDGREIDFLVTKKGTPAMMIEVKWSDDERSPNFSFFEKNTKSVKKVQIVKELKREKTYPDGTEIRTACKWLSEITLK